MKNTTRILASSTRMRKSFATFGNKLDPPGSWAVARLLRLLWNQFDALRASCRNSLCSNGSTSCFDRPEFHLEWCGACDPRSPICPSHTSSPERVGSVYALLEEHLYGYFRIRINGGKTQVWNQAGVRPGACDVLERIARTSDPHAHVWKGPGLPEERQGMKVLGAPLGHPAFVEAFLEKKIAEQRILLDRIPLVADLQASWLLLLHCASARANYLIRVVESGAVAQYASRHDEGLWNCLCAILKVDFHQTPLIRDTATMTLVLGGMGLRSASRTRTSAFWASWADSLAMIHAHHREVASQFVYALENDLGGPCLSAAAQARRTLTGVMGFEPPSWQAVAEGARPETQPPDEFEPGGVRPGWQHEAASRTEEHFREVLFDTISDRDRALIRSQAGPGAGVALRVAPTSRLTSIQPHLFRVVLLRRLRLPLPLSVRSCRCGRAIDIFGHHRAACARAGVLGRRGFALESAVARICREAGGRVATNTFMRDMDLAVPATDNRRLEVVVDGLPLWHDPRVCDALRRFSTPWSRRAWWCCSRDSAQAEGTTLPRIGGTSKQSSIGGARGGSWGQVVGRDQVFPCPLGQGTVSSRGASFAETRRTGVAHEVGGHSRMRFSQGCRRVSSRVERLYWRRWWVPFQSWGGWWPPLCWSRAMRGGAFGSVFDWCLMWLCNAIFQQWRREKKKKLCHFW